MKNKYTVMILGASEMQVPAITIAKQKGWTVIVAARDRDGPGVALSDYFENVDLKDKEAMADAAERHQKERGLDGVFTAGTDFSTTVAWVAAQLGLPGISYEAALNASDKALMRKVFDACGVPSPVFAAIGAEDDPKSVLTDLDLPLVIKPVDNMGARGVRRVDSVEELEAAAREAIKLSRTSKVIVERYIEGPEFSLDALVYQGKIILCGNADRHIRFPPYFVEMGHTMPSDFSKDVKTQVEQTFFQGIRALEIDNGAAKGDIKFSQDGPVVGEIAARLSGGYMSGWTYPYASGVIVTEGALNIAVGLPPGNLEPKHNRVSAERAFISIPGEVAEIDGTESARQIAGIKKLVLRVTKGDQVDFPINNVQKCGNAISQRETRTDAAYAAEEACRRMLVRLVPGNAATEEFLFGSLNGWIPYAYCLERKENIAAYSEMEVFGGFQSSLSMEDFAISIFPLPEIGRETCVDWHGTTFEDGLRKVSEITGLPIGGTALNFLGKIFWYAFLKGGLQAGIWIIDTVRAVIREGGDVSEILGKWANISSLS